MVSSLPKSLANPINGHLIQALHIFRYLDFQNQNDLAFDICSQYVTSDQDNEPNIRVLIILYVDAINKLPPNSPKLRGRRIYIYCFVDSDHAGDTVTRCSQTIILLYFNIAPIIFYSKHQNTVEISTFRL